MTFMRDKTNDEVIISGIQQVGIGVPDVQAAFKWYRQRLEMDVPVFSDAGEAALMVRYTGGQAERRHAILAINLNGGSGLEIWQFTSRTPVGPPSPVVLGDLGINVLRIKSADLAATRQNLLDNGADVLTEITPDPAGNPHFLLRDPYANLIQVVPGESWYRRGVKTTGGACGCLIGVSDVAAAQRLYGDVLGYDRVVYDETGVFPDLAALPGGEGKLRRVLLAHGDTRRGGFSRLIGESRLELVQCLERQPRRIFEGRYWGDLGFIHLCFDINGMDAMRRRCEAAGFPFTVDSRDSFDMGDAAGHFSYVEDPDGTLIEFVETHRIPILKKLGIFLDLRRRDPAKPLPGLLVRMLALGRVRD
jgi:catechol 2,3-dioxygenase-like lactoylglutathione lyase family enzyme